MALEGTLLGHYRLVRLIGGGGMGEVYLAEDTRLPRRVAIKVVRNEVDAYPNAETTKDAVRLFEREMRAITTLDHSNILPLIDFGEEKVNNTLLAYMVMPFRSEGSLVDWLHAQNGATTLPPQDVVYLVLQAARALQHAHNQNLLHLDVKPSNFLIRRREDTPNRPDLLLADFGISKFNSATATMSQSIRGTPAYMAPEQWAGSPVAATDQYALAIMAYQLLTGRPPFQGNIQQAMYQHLQEQPKPPSTFNAQIPAAVDNVLLRALAKKPEDRYPSISAFATAFEQAWRSDAAPIAPPPPPSTRYSFPAPASTPPPPMQYATPAPPTPLPPMQYAAPAPPTPLPPMQYAAPAPTLPSTPYGQPAAAVSGPKKTNTVLVAVIIGLIVVVVIGGLVLTRFPSSNTNNAASSNGGTQNTPIATTPTSSYPQLKASYSGSYSAPGVNSQLQLTGITEDQQGNIAGTLTFSATGDNCPFVGHVTTNNSITFTCTFSADSIYDFSGTVFASTDGHIAGNYQKRNNSTDVGTWNVSPS